MEFRIKLRPHVTLDNNGIPYPVEMTIIHRNIIEKRVQIPTYNVKLQAISIVLKGNAQIKNDKKLSKNIKLDLQLINKSRQG